MLFGTVTEKHYCFSTHAETLDWPDVFWIQLLVGASVLIFETHYLWWPFLMPVVSLFLSPYLLLPTACLPSFIFHPMIVFYFYPYTFSWFCITFLPTCLVNFISPGFFPLYTTSDAYWSVHNYNHNPTFPVFTVSTFGLFLYPKGMVAHTEDITLRP